jgi:hypothetical protein
MQRMMRDSEMLNVMMDRMRTKWCFMIFSSSIAGTFCMATRIRADIYAQTSAHDDGASRKILLACLFE